MSDLQLGLFSTFDEPYHFTGKNNNKLIIYPGLVKDIFRVNYFGDVLSIDKNSIPDKDIIQMTYLEYLIREHIKGEQEENLEKQYLSFLYALLVIVLRNDELKFAYGFDEKGKPYIVLDDVVFDRFDFDKIKEIICHQNLIELPDESIQKILRDKAKEAEEIRRKMSGNKQATLEDYIISLAVSTGWKYDDIYNMPIRKFRKSLERIDHKIHYEIYMNASLSGFVKFEKKDAIKHWMSSLEKDKMSGFMAEEDFENKVGVGRSVAKK